MAKTVKTAPAAADAATETANPVTALATKGPVYDWFKDKIDEDSGELIRVPKYKYLEGNPKQYRTDNKNGQFNLNGVKMLGDTFTLQPIAWRVFEDDILTMGLKQWIELFFIDETGSVSAILFHSYSCENLLNLAEPLFYDEKTLADVVLTVTLGEHVAEKVVGKPKYFIAEFSYVEGEPELTRELKAYAKTVKLYRRATLTPNANFSAVHRYHNPLEVDDVNEAGTGQE